MGWWNQNSRGVSFTGVLTWGDEPADLVDDFLIEYALFKPDATVGDVMELVMRMNKTAGDDGGERADRGEDLAWMLVSDLQELFRDVALVLDDETLRSGLMFSLGEDERESLVGARIFIKQAVDAGA